MKSQRIISFQKLVSYAIIILLLGNACAPSGGSDNTTSENNAKAQSKAVTPAIDLPTAVVTGNLEIVRQHIEAGTDINAKDQMSGSTPLITAASFGKTDIAEALIDANADLKLKNTEGATALHAAAFFGRIEIVQLLIDAGADKTVKNKFGATPRQSVMGPFAEVKPVYEMMKKQLEPFGLQLDLAEVEKARPVIAMMLQ